MAVVTMSKRSAKVFALPTLKETQIQRAIMDLLAAEGVFAIRMNTLALRDGRGVPIAAHSGGRGVADILATPLVSKWPWGERTYPSPVPAVLWIEVKRPGRRQTPEQVTFQQRVEELGHHYLVATSTDDVLSFLQEHRTK